MDLSARVPEPSLVCVCVFKTTPCGMWDLSSLTKDGTRDPCIGSAES